MKKQICTFVFAVLCFVGGANFAAAQGGWDAWDIFLRDGTTWRASPLTVVDNEKFGTGLNNDASAADFIERAKIDRLTLKSNTSPAPALPPAPIGDFAEDAVVKMNGEQTFGSVIFKKVEWSSGTIEQNGVEINLRDVAHIAFAKAQSNDLKVPKSNAAPVTKNRKKKASPKSKPTKRRAAAATANRFV